MKTSPGPWVVGALRVIGIKLAAIAILAVLFSATVTLTFAVATGAAWFALGDQMPRVPWFMLRMFLFIAWCCALGSGLFAPTSARRTTDGEEG